jgi:hypothetical protein
LSLSTPDCGNRKNSQTVRNFLSYIFIHAWLRYRGVFSSELDSLFLHFSKVNKSLLKSSPFSKIFKLTISNKELRKEKMNNGEEKKKPTTIAFIP